MGENSTTFWGPVHLVLYYLRPNESYVIKPDNVLSTSQVLTQLGSLGS